MKSKANTQECVRNRHDFMRKYLEPLDIFLKNIFKKAFLNSILLFINMCQYLMWRIIWQPWFRNSGCRLLSKHDTRYLSKIENLSHQSNSDPCKKIKKNWDPYNEIRMKISLKLPPTSHHEFRLTRIALCYRNIYRAKNDDFFNFSEW